jgi:hypothetical protein
MLGHITKSCLTFQSILLFLTLKMRTKFIVIHSHSRLDSQHGYLSMHHTYLLPPLHNLAKVGDLNFVR